MELLTQIIQLVSATAVFWLPIIGLSWISSYYSRIFGYRATVLFGFIGVVVHELSHLVACYVASWVARYRVVRVSLFSLKYDGTLGFVEYAYSIRWYSPFINLLIAIAPLAGGTVAFGAVTLMLRPDLSMSDFQSRFYNTQGILEKFTLIMSDVFSQGEFVNTAAWVLVSFSILMFTSPSKADFKGCRAGVLCTIGVFCAVMSLWPAGAVAILSWALPYLSFFGSTLVFILFVMTFLFISIIAIKKSVSKILSAKADL